MPTSTESPPSLGAAFRRALEKAMEQIRVSIPAVVISYDEDAETCSAQPIIHHPGPEGGYTEDPALTEVPVIFGGTRRARFKFPLAKGDVVMLSFLDRAYDAWANSLADGADAARTRVPTERRFHDYNDVVAYPMATRPDGNQVTVEFDDDNQRLLVHKGTRANAVALATLADLQALVATFNAHTHPKGTFSCTGGTISGSSGDPADAASPTGTSVLRGE